MGRASRRRKSSQAARDLKRRLLAADRAERRGQAVPPTVEGYEAAAGAGPIAVQEALLARHNARMIRFANPRRANYAGIRSVLGPAAHAAMALTRLGADPDRWPCDPYGSWADHLRWGIDSVTATARLVFAGQIVGAAMLIRQQLERWTENLAHNARLYQNRGESRAEYITRVWACEESHSSTTRRNEKGVSFGTPIIPWHGARAGQLFSELSELTHGRGIHVAAARWDAIHLLDTFAEPADQAAVAAAHGLITATAALVVHRLRVCVESLARESGQPREAIFVRALPDMLPAGRFPPQPWALWPLVPLTGLANVTRERFTKARETYDAVRAGQRPAGRLFTEVEMVDLYFIASRARSVEAAMTAFEAERRMSGKELDFGNLNAREHLFIFSSEAASLLAAWNAGSPVADAASAAASALRSAYWLWLEDDDRAMAMLRVVLEQVARIRTWRVKPDKAAKLEASLNATPRDWLEESGLRRLSAMNRALGELSHFRPASDWVGARNLIVELQPEDTRGEWSAYTGRGEALDQVARMLFRESADSVRRRSVPLSDAFIKMLNWFGDASQEADRRFDEYMQHVWSLRGARPNGSRFTGPANDHLRLWRLFGKGTDDPISAETSWMLPFVSDTDPLGRPRSED